MNDTDNTNLLKEIRDELSALRATSEEAVQMQRRALELTEGAVASQQSALADQQRIIAMSRKAWRFIPIVVIVLLALLAFLLVRHSGFLF